MEKPRLWILVLLVSFASVNGILFTPALPEMAEYYKVSDQIIQLTISLYLFGYAVGNLIYGPLASAYGRKPVLKMSILFTIITTVFVLFSGDINSISLLLVARFLKALAAVGAMKIVMTMISDSFEEKEAARALSYILTSFALAPGVSIFIGGWLTDWFGWQSNFYFLILYGIVFFYLATLLPETLNPESKQPLSIKTTLINYGQAVHNSRLLLGATVLSLGTACVYVYSTAAPFIGIEVMGLSPGVYGILNLIPSIGMFISGVVNAQLVKRMRPVSALQFGVYAITIGAVWMLIAFAFGQKTPWMLFLPMFIVYIGIGLNFPNSTATGLIGAPNKSYASAVLNTINVGMSVVPVLVLSVIPTIAPMVLPTLLTIIAALAIVFYILLRRKALAPPA